MRNLPTQMIIIPNIQKRTLRKRTKNRIQSKQQTSPIFAVKRITWQEYEGERSKIPAVFFFPTREDDSNENNPGKKSFFCWTISKSNGPKYQIFIMLWKPFQVFHSQASKNLYQRWCSIKIRSNVWFVISLAKVEWGTLGRKIMRPEWRIFFCFKDVEI